MASQNFEAVDSTMSWSSFDAFIWDEFEENENHRVPNSERNMHSMWIDSHYRRANTRCPQPCEGSMPMDNRKYQNEDTMFQMDAETDNKDASLHKMQSSPLQLECWDNLHVADFGLMPEVLEAKPPTPDVNEHEDFFLNRHIYAENNPNGISTSNHFLLSRENPEQQDPGLFAEEAKVSTLLVDTVWGIGNLDDMEMLFQSNSTSPDTVEDKNVDSMQWSRPAASNVSRLMDKALPDFEEKPEMDFEDQDYVDVSSIDSQHPQANLESMLDQEANCQGASSESYLEPSEALFQDSQDLASKANNKVGTSPSEKPLETSEQVDQSVTSGDLDLHGPDRDKAYRMKRQFVNRRRRDDKILPYKRVPYSSQNSAPELTSQQSLMGGNLQSTEMNSMALSHAKGFQQALAPSTPAILNVNNTLAHRPSSISCFPSNYGMPVHHMPFVGPGSSPQIQPSQHVLVGYQHAGPMPQRQQYVQNQIGPPVSGIHMTPQEKIEKLRWRKQMQAKLALQHHHRQHALDHQPFGAQQKPPILPLDSQLSEGPGTGSQPSPMAHPHLKSEEEESSVGAKVLGQLESIMSQLGVGARLCIRDSLYRLARSAMMRRSSDINANAQGFDHSLARAENDANRLPGNMGFETDTNPIDRTVMSLLYSKQPTQSPTANVGQHLIMAPQAIVSSSESQASWTWRQTASTWIDPSSAEPEEPCHAEAAHNLISDSSDFIREEPVPMMADISPTAMETSIDNVSGSRKRPNSNPLTHQDE